jgi:hypothetical protein
MSMPHAPRLPLDTLTAFRELRAADALCDGRLVRLSPISIMHAEAQPYHLVYPPNLRDWPPLKSFRGWLFAQLDASLTTLRASITEGAPKSRRTAAATATATAAKATSRATARPTPQRAPARYAIVIVLGLGLREIGR